MSSTTSIPGDTTRQNDAITPYLWGMFGLCFLGNILGGAVSTMMSGYLPVVMQDIPAGGDGKVEQLGAIMSAVYFVGWAFGGLFMGFVGDRIGRVRALAIALLLFGAATILLRFSGSWGLIITLRLLAGFGVGAMLVLNTTLLSEVWPQPTRAVFLGILSIGFPVGIFSSGALNYFIASWRDAAVIGVVPLLLGISIRLYIRESEEWRQARSAAQTGITTHRLSAHRRELAEGAVIFSSMLIGLWAIFSWVPSWVQSLLTTSDGMRERGLSMMLLGAGGLSGGFVSGWISNLLGARRAMIMCFASCFVLSAALFLGNTTFGLITVIEIALLAFTFGISQGLLSVYVPQLFPPSIRARATGFCFNIGRFFTAASVFFVGALVTTLGGYGSSLFAFSFVFLIGLLFILFTRKINRQ